MTTCGGFHHPASMDPAVRSRVEAACARGGTSIHSTGSSPGFISEAMPIVLTSLQRRLDRLRIAEFADLSSRDSPNLLFNIMGFAQDPSAFDPRRWAHGAVAFGPSLRLVGDAVGMPLDSVESSGEVATAIRDVEIAAGTVPAGSVAGQRMTVVGRRNGEELITFSATWYCSAELDAAWDLRASGWRVTVDGDCPLDMELRCRSRSSRWRRRRPATRPTVPSTPCRSSARPLPGIRTTVDLPQVVANLGQKG